MKNTNILTVAAFTLFTAPAFAVNPYAKDDNTWISIHGKVASVLPDQFELDYGEGFITVEMDDGDRDADGYKLFRGDEVRVSGMIDDDFYEQTTIEASSVYVKNIDTYFYASAIDEEDYAYTYTVISPVLTETVIEGTITKVSVNEEEFTLDTGTQMLTVEVDELLNNPLDNKGYQQLDVGDRVSVNGRIDNDLFEGRVFEADYVSSIKKVGTTKTYDGVSRGDMKVTPDREYYDKEKNKGSIKNQQHPAHEMGEGDKTPYEGQ